MTIVSSRRLLTAAAAATALTLVLSACGGSDVADPSAAGAGTTAAQTGTTPADTTAADTTATDATVPGAGAAATGTGAAAGTGTAAGTAGVPGTGTAADTTKTETTKTDTTKTDTTKTDTTKTAPGSTAATSAVAKTVANSAIFGGTAPCKPATLSEVNIGNVSTLSGVLGELFAPVRPALATFVASQNACGGLNGHKIKFFIDDDQGDPATAAAKVQNMIQNNKVLAFTGNIQVLTVDAVAPTIKKAGIPIIGADLTNNTWFTNPLMFPQGSGPQSISYGYLVGATKYHKITDVGNIWCIEVPRACEQINRAYLELAPQFGATVKKSIQVSITAPTYVQQCLDFKNSGVKALAMTFDAASQNRLARSCEQVRYFPKIMPYPLSVGNEKQFLGNKWLGDAYVPMNHFPWMGNSTAAEKYWQASIKKFNPGFTSGGAASLGWGSGALLVAAAAGLSETNPTTQQLLDTLYTFKGQKFTELGGLTGPLTFRKGSTPKIPYCLFAAISNDANTGWKTVISKPTCTDTIAPSDPQKNS